MSQRKRERERKREIEQERERESKSGKGKGKEIERTKAWAIIFLNRPGQKKIHELYSTVQERVV